MSLAWLLLVMLSPIALGCAWKPSKLQIIECFEKVISLPKILSYLFEASEYVSIATIISLLRHVIDTETGVVHYTPFMWQLLPSIFVHATHPLFLVTKRVNSNLSELN